MKNDSTKQGLFSIQLISFVVGIPVAMVLAVTSFVRKRCQRAGIEVPSVSKWQKGIYISFPIIAAFTIYYLNTIAEQVFTPLNSAKPAIAIAVLTLVIIIFPLIRMMFMKQKYSRFKMTLYVNLIPYIIMMLMAVSVIVRPYLDREEIRLLKEDKCMFPERGFTAVEDKVTIRLKEQLDKVLSELPDRT